MDSAILATIGVALLAVMTLVPWRTPLVRATVFGAFALTTIAYLIWRLDAWRYHATSIAAFSFQVVFIAFELLGLGYDLLSTGYLICRTDRSAEANDCVRRLSDRDDRPLVAVLIPTASEPGAVVAATLDAVFALSQSCLRLIVILCDDGKYKPGDDAETRAEKRMRRSALVLKCRRLRALGLDIRYRRRKDSKDAKAGNLNSALKRLPHGVRYLGVLDADHQPCETWLTTAVAYLECHDEVGVLQTPQTFRSPDILGINLFAPWAIPENQNAFMRVVQSSRDSYGAAFCIGSGFVVRFSLIEELNGFPGDTLAEDVTLTLAGLSRGYATHFLNEKLSHGLAPRGVSEFIAQQRRWAIGSIQHLFHRYGPLRNPRMTWLQRVLFMELIAFWMTFITMALMLLAPAVYWLTGVSAVPNRHASGMMLIMFARWLARELAGYVLTDGRSAPVIGMFGRVIACFPVAEVVLLALAFPRVAWPWHVTGKPDEIRTSAVVNWVALLPLLGLAAVTALGLLANGSGAVG